MNRFKRAGERAGPFCLGCNNTPRTKTAQGLEVVILFAGEQFGCENGKLFEERFGEGFLFFGRKAQMLVDFGFHGLKFFSRGKFGEALEEELVGAFAFHYFEAVEYLAMRSAFPDGEN